MNVNCESRLKSLPSLPDVQSVFIFIFCSLLFRHPFGKPLLQR